jgi:hypothetical protein
MKGTIMAKPLLKTVPTMSNEEIADLNRELTKRAIRNIVIFAGLKLALYYGIHRMAKRAAETI